MIKLAFFDFSKTVTKGSGLYTGAVHMKRENEFDKIFGDFISNKLIDEDFINSAIKLWEGFKEEDSERRLNSPRRRIEQEHFLVQISIVAHASNKFVAGP